jgi:hypothetical protein
MANAIKQTIDLNAVKSGAPFPYGKVCFFHKIGIYDIVEFVQVTNGIESTHGEFIAFVKNRCTFQTHSSMDAALANAIAYNHEGPETTAWHYFMKMIKY